MISNEREIRLFLCSNIRSLGINIVPPQGIFGAKSTNLNEEKEELDKKGISNYK